MKEQNKYQVILCMLILILAVTTVYWNTLDNSFVYDDKYLIQGNPELGDIDKYVYSKSWTRLYNNRSLTNLSFSINHKIGGVKVFGYHLVNLVVHLIATLITFFIVRKIYKLIRPAKEASENKILIISLITALAFGLHPIQTDAVSYITQRYASMAGLFVLLGAYFYILFREKVAEKRRLKRTLFLLLSIISGVFAILSKETGLSLFLFVIMIEYLVFQMREEKKEIKVFYTLLVGLILFAAIYISINGFPLQTKEYSPLEYLFTQQKVVLNYLQLLILPINQHLIHFISLESVFWNAKVIFPLIIHLFTLYLAFRLIKSHRILSMGIIWIYLGLMIESSIIPLQYFMNEYRLYLSMFGFALILGYLVFLSKSRFSYPIGFIVILIYGLLTINRNDVWQNEEQMWIDNIKKSPENPTPYNALGYYYHLQGESHRGMTYINKAIELDSTYINAYLNRGVINYNINNEDGAWADYQTILRIDSLNFLALCNIGAILTKRGNLIEGRDFLRKSIQSNNGYYKVYYDMGLSHYIEKQYDSASFYFSESIRRNNLFEKSYNNLGVVYLEENKLNFSIEQFEKALELNPLYLEPYINMGIAYRRARDFTKSLDYLNLALNLNPTSDIVLYHRGLTLYENKRKEEAVGDFERIRDKELKKELARFINLR